MSKLLKAEFNPQGEGNLFLGHKPEELTRGEQKFLRMNDVSDRHIAHISRENRELQKRALALH